MNIMPKSSTATKTDKTDTKNKRARSTKKTPEPTVAVEILPELTPDNTSTIEAIERDTASECEAANSKGITATCKQEELRDAIENIARFEPKNPPQPILTHVLIEANVEEQTLRLTAYNLKAAVKTTISANITESGTITASIELMCKIVQKLKGTLTLQSTPTELHLRDSDTSIYQIPGLDAKEFPEVPNISGEAQTVAADALKAALQATLYAASSDEKNLILTGVQFRLSQQTLKLTATDGNRIAVCASSIAPAGRSRRKQSLPDWHLTVSHKLLRDVDRMIGVASGTGKPVRTETVKLYYEADTQWVGFEWGNVQVMANVFDDSTFPDCGKIISDHSEHHSQTVLVEKAKLLLALDRLSALTESARHEPSVVLHFSGADQQIELNVEHNSGGRGSEIVLSTIPAAFSTLR